MITVSIGADERRDTGMDVSDEDGRPESECVITVSRRLVSVAKGLGCAGAFLSRCSVRCTVVFAGAVERSFWSLLLRRSLETELRKRGTMNAAAIPRRIGARRDLSPGCVAGSSVGSAGTSSPVAESEFGESGFFLDVPVLLPEIP